MLAMPPLPPSQMISSEPAIRSCSRNERRSQPAPIHIEPQQRAFDVIAKGVAQQSPGGVISFAALRGAATPVKFMAPVDINRKALITCKAALSGIPSGTHYRKPTGSAINPE